MQAKAWLSLGALVASSAYCGFHPNPTSGTVVCGSERPSCCPEGYVCAGRGAALAEGSTAPGLGTCWRIEDVPAGNSHDYTPDVAYDPACLVTDWLPPGMVPFQIRDAGVGGGGAGGDPYSSGTKSDASTSGPPPGPSYPGLFDPNIVYIKLAKGEGVWAERRIFNPSNPSKSLLGLPELTKGMIRPTDGALIYANYLELSDISTAEDAVVMFEFAPDKSAGDWPTDNDIQYPLPKCTSSATYQYWIGIAPDTGDILTQCGYTYTYLQSGIVLQNGVYDAYAIGHGGRHFFNLSGGRGNTILNLDGTHVDTLESPTSFVKVRSSPTGFWILTASSKTPNMERWHVLYDGSVSEHVSYPPNPLATSGNPYLEYSLDGAGRAVVVMIVADGSIIFMEDARYVVLRFDPNMPSGEVLMDLAKYPDLHYAPFESNLITGP
jgi:hypothetical protein